MGKQSLKTRISNKACDAKNLNRRAAYNFLTVIEADVRIFNTTVIQMQHTESTQ